MYGKHKTIVTISTASSSVKDLVKEDASYSKILHSQDNNQRHKHIKTLYKISNVLAHKI